MVNLLVVTFDAGGNVPPPLGIAQRLMAEGGHVHVLGSPSPELAVAAAGLPFEPYRAEEQWWAARPRTLMEDLLQLGRTRADASIAADAVRVARREHVDVVLVDCMRTGVRHTAPWRPCSRASTPGGLDGGATSAKSGR